MNLPVFSSKPLKYLPGVQLLEGSLRGNTGLSVGIDPGVNFGLTIINMEYVQVMYGKLPTDKRPGYRGIAAYEFIRSSVLKDFKPAPGVEKFKAVVEGAAYSAQHGQVVLEEVRFGFFLALHHIGFDTIIIPPATIRKAVLGNGRASVAECYPTMNHNAADSIGIAMYGLKEING